MKPKQMRLQFPGIDPLQQDLDDIMRMIPSTETDYDTHNIHPYPAKFLPHYPEIFIRHFSKKGDLVVDPMCGAGTTLIEASLANRHAFGIDIEPIACLISSVSITPIRKEELTAYEEELMDLLEKAFADNGSSKISLPSEEEFPNVKLWFRPEVFRELILIRDIILNSCCEAKYKNFALLVLSSIVKPVSNADPRDIFPERDQANPVRERKDVLEEFKQAFLENKKRVIQFSRSVNYQQQAIVSRGDARNIALADKSVDLIFTSPPYCYAIDYARVHKLSTLLFIMDNEQFKKYRRNYIGTDRISVTTPLSLFDGFEFAKQEIEAVYEGDRKLGVILYRYFSDIYQVTKECNRILKPGGYLIYVIGNSTVRGTHFNTDDILMGICQRAGLSIQKTMERPYYAYRMARKRNVQSNTIKKDVFIIAQIKAGSACSVHR